MTQLFSDDFNRANGALGANWFDAATALAISSNQVAFPAAAALTVYTGTPPGADRYVRYTCVTKPASPNAVGCVVLYDSSSNGYALIANTDGGSAGATFMKFTAGTPATLGATFATPADGAEIIVARNSTAGTLGVYYDRVLQVSRSDSSYNTAEYTGFYGLGSSARTDNFRTGNLISVLSSSTATAIASGSATLGGTTDEDWGTLYVVVDTAANLSGVTAAQVVAGQKASGSAARASANSAVTTTSPAATVTGLSPGSYSYALVQDLFGARSNVLSGTFAYANSAMLLMGCG